MARNYEERRERENHERGRRAARRRRSEQKNHWFLAAETRTERATVRLADRRAGQ